VNNESVDCSAVVLGRKLVMAVKRRHHIWQVDHLMGMAEAECWLQNMDMANLG